VLTVGTEMRQTVLCDDDGGFSDVNRGRWLCSEAATRALKE
jgi:hypothetical protein